MSQVLQQCLGPTANTGKLGFYILYVCEVHISLYVERSNNGLPISKGKVGGTVLLKLHGENCDGFLEANRFFSKWLILVAIF